MSEELVANTPEFSKRARLQLPDPNVQLLLRRREIAAHGGIVRLDLAAESSDLEPTCSVLSSTHSSCTTEASCSDFAHHRLGGQMLLHVLLHMHECFLITVRALVASSSSTQGADPIWRKRHGFISNIAWIKTRCSQVRRSL